MEYFNREAVLLNMALGCCKNTLKQGRTNKVLPLLEVSLDYKNLLAREA